MLAAMKSFDRRPARRALSDFEQELLAELRKCKPYAVDLRDTYPYHLLYEFQAQDKTKYFSVVDSQATNALRVLAEEEGDGVVVIGANVYVRGGQVSVNAKCAMRAHTDPESE